MKTIFAALIAAFVCVAVPQEADATKLKPETLKAWDTYVQLTEKRIDTELTSTSGSYRPTS